VLVYFVLFRTAFFILVTLSNVLFNLYYLLCTFIVVYYFGIIIVLFIYTVLTLYWPPRC
jgi:hypothetical protein